MFLCGKEGRRKAVKRAHKKAMKETKIMHKRSNTNKSVKGYGHFGFFKGN
jgi:hypothetical protein